MFTIEIQEFIAQLLVWVGQAVQFDGDFTITVGDKKYHHSVSGSLCDGMLYAHYRADNNGEVICSELDVQVGRLVKLAQPVIVVYGALLELYVSFLKQAGELFTLTSR